MSIKTFADSVQRRLGQRRLVYFGTRGTDVSPLTKVMNVASVFSLIAPSRLADFELCLEEITSRRMDLNDYDLDNDRSPAANIFRQTLWQETDEGAAVLAYRPAQALTSAWVFSKGQMVNLGLLSEGQRRFEQKPWVEIELAKIGIPTIPWEYVEDLRAKSILRVLEDGPLVIRQSESSGGAGVYLVSSLDQLQDVPPASGGFYSVASFIHSISVNINACVYSDGEVSFHPSSMQLIGVDLCSRKPFAFCGSDFSSIWKVCEYHVDAMDEMVRKVGFWLSRNRYVGAFGVDALVCPDGILFVEINPRFQGSSALSAVLDEELGRPDQFLCHIAASLGLEPNDQMSLAELLGQQNNKSQITFYNRESYPIRMTPPDCNGCSIETVPNEETVIEPNGVLFSALFPYSVSTDGSQLERGLDRRLRSLLATVEVAEVV